LSGHQGAFPGFDNSTRNITHGVNDIGLGLQDVAKGVSDCHLQAFADLLAPLAAKFAHAPELTWVDAFVKIMIDGVQIEQELANACLDFGKHNWPGFGYNLMELTKTLLKKPGAEAIYV